MSSSGVIYGSNYHYIYYSYGSPYADWDGVACCVDPSGDVVYISGSFVDVMYSYGSPYTEYIGHANIVYPVGSVDYLGRISSSYGKFRSPGTGGFDANYAWNVDKSGNIPLFSDHENSYGHTFILRSPAIDTVADSIFYVATDGGAYISDYISTYSYGHHFIFRRTTVSTLHGGLV